MQFLIALQSYNRLHPDFCEFDTISQKNLFFEICLQNSFYFFNFAIESRDKSVAEEIEKNHIKVDWETHQILLKCRDKLSRPMAGPIPSGRLFKPRRITKGGEHSNPVIRSFIASFGVALIERVALAALLFVIKDVTFLFFYVFYPPPPF